jgi:hypothetical protein
MTKLFKRVNGELLEFDEADYAQAEIDRAQAPIIFAESARNYRAELLAETDWTQLADVPQATKDVWIAYRQALRDVPQQAGFPTNVVWPTKPT